MTSQGLELHERRAEDVGVRAPPAGSGVVRVRADGLRPGQRELADAGAVQVRLARAVRREQGGHRGRFQPDHAGLPQVRCLKYFAQRRGLSLKSECEIIGTLITQAYRTYRLTVIYLKIKV